MSMKIKTALDMQGNGIENFLIQGVSAIEGLSDKSLGRKILYTGTNTDRNYREMIYIGNSIGGDGWRTTAYMSDVDELRGLITALESATDEEIEALKGRATTLEGRVDTIDNMLNVENSQTVVDTWEEVKKFLASVSEETDLITLLNGKANAGIENGKGYVALPYANNKQAFIFYDGGFNWSLTNEGWTGSYRILHLGNYSDYALPLTGGTMKDASTINWGGNLVGWDDVSNGFIGISNFKGDSTFGYYVGLSFKGYYGFQIRSYGGGDLYEVRGHNSSNWGTWRTLLHSGNVGEYNAGSATKLETPRTIWGQSFDGTADVSGALRHSGKKFVTPTDSYVIFGEGYINEGDITQIDGHTIVMRSGGKQYAMFVNSSGNVTIGESDLATSANGNPKLYVDGGTTINVFNSKGEEGILGAKTEGSFFLGKNFGLQLWTNGYGNVYGQVGRIDGTPTAYNLILQHLGGNILIGTTSELNSGAKLQIKGDLYVEGNIIATKEVSAGGAGTEGEGGAGGFSLYESWGTSAPTEPLALGANLGYELKTRVEDLELAKTKVTFEPELVSGKPIGTITIDGNKTNLFAPATYAWSEITGTENVLTTAGGEIVGSFDAFTINRNGGGAVSSIAFKHSDSLLYGYLGFDNVNNPMWMDSANNRFSLIHEGNYFKYALPLTGGTIDNRLTISSESDAKIILNETGTDVKYQQIAFQDNGVEYGRLGTYGDDQLKWTDKTLLHQGNYVDLIGDTYLKTSGGTITGVLTAKSAVSIYGRFSIYGLQEYRTTENHEVFLANNYYTGSGDGKGLAIFTDNHWYDLLHSGNVGDYALKTDGSNAMNAPLHLYYSAIDKYDGTFVCQSNLAGGAPFDYASVVNIEDERFSSMQLAWYRNLGKPMLSFRLSENGTFSAWKTIAFTDSNVASAQALTHSNGTVGATVSETGNLSINRRISSADDLLNLFEYSAGFLYLGYSLRNEHTTRVYGNKIEFLTGDTQRMLINSSGNVTIGASDLAGTDAKLYVAGDIATSGNLLFNHTKGLGFATSDGKTASIFVDNYNNLQLGYQNVSSVRFNSGNVLIGTTEDNGAKLQVAGTIVSESITHRASISDNAITHYNKTNGGFFLYGGVREGEALSIEIAGNTGSWVGQGITLKQNGNVGIGTTEDSGAKLNVHGGLFVNKYLESGNKSGAYVVINKGTDYFGIGGSASGVAKMSFGTTSDTIGTWKKEIMTFLDNGRVGIGTTDPQAKLEVVGSSRFIGSLSASSAFDLNRNANNGDIFNSDRAAFEIETFANIVRFRTFNPDANNALTFYGSQGNVGIGKIAYTHKLEVDGNVHISGSLIVDGEVSAGGTGTEGGNTGGGGSTGTITNPYVVNFTPSNETSHSFYHNLPYYDVVVQVYEKNAISGAWDMILADVTIANESRLVTVDFGRKENVEHKIVVR